MEDNKIFNKFVNNIFSVSNEVEDEFDGTLSNLIFNIWLTNKLDEHGVNFNNNYSDEYIDDKLTEILSKIHKDNDFAEEELKEILFTFGYKMREDLRLSSSGFQIRLAQHYGLEIYYMELIDILTRELGILFNNFQKEITENKLIGELILHQHSRACSIFAEIIHLIKGGFGTGAISRFRSLHEASVVTEFVVKHGEQAAECYFDYLPVMDMKDIIFQEQELNQKQDDFFIQKVRERLESIKIKRGEKFVDSSIKNDYFWANDFISGNPTFNQIRKSINRKHGLKPYKIASHNIHSAPKSIISSLGSQDGLFVTGASNVGISLPGMWSTYEIVQLNRLIVLFLQESNLNDLFEYAKCVFILKNINTLAKLLYDNFSEKEEQLLE